MTDKKEERNNGEEKEEHFTGSPEEQLPDLEAEDSHDQSEGKKENDRNTEQDKDQ